jgi:hypothetical protein
MPPSALGVLSSNSDLPGSTTYFFVAWSHNAHLVTGTVNVIETFA